MIPDASLAFEHLLVSPAEAVQLVKSGDRVYLGSNCGQPQTLTQALFERRETLEDVEIVHLLVSGAAPYANAAYTKHFRHTGFFIAANTRPGTLDGSCDYIPMFLHEIPFFIASGVAPIDVAMVSVTPPDSDGYVSLGISVDIGASVCAHAKTLIAEIQPQMPRTFGDNRLHISQFAACVLSNHDLLQHAEKPISDVDRAIATNVGKLIQDGSCLQVGIGHIPDAILSSLFDRNDLGVHSELIGDRVGELYRSGNITNAKKQIYAGKSVATFSLASRFLYDIINENPDFEFRPTEQVNDPFVVAQNDNVVAINGALQVDLTGQVVSDSTGHRIYSGVGGQVDFIRGATRSKNGKPVIALPSTAKGGTISRIVASLNPGAGVVTTRSDVHWVATEHGLVNLYGAPLRKRAELMLSIADPAFRDQLAFEAKSCGLLLG